MSKLSFIDKLGILFEVSKSSKLYILVLILLVVLGVVFSTTNRKTAKRNKIIYILVTIFIMVLIVATYHAPLGNMFSYMMDNFFIAAFFPNLAIYCAAIVIMNIILWISLFNYRTSNSIKLLNIVVYVIMNYLLALVLNVINTNSLDVFTQSSVYGNKEATALIELSSLVFLVWILFLIIYKIILVYLRKDYKPQVKKILVKRTVKKLPENYEPTNTPSFVYTNKKTNIKEEVPEVIGLKDIIPEEPSQNLGLKDIIPFDNETKYTSNNNQSIIGNLLIEDDEEDEEDYVPLLDEVKEKPVIYDEPVIIESHEVTQEELTKPFEQLLTLEDYKLLLRMLKEQKEKDKLKEQEENELQKEQDKLKEEQEKLRKEKEKIEIKKKEKEDKKYNELLDLYRVN